MNKIITGVLSSVLITSQVKAVETKLFGSIEGIAYTTTLPSQYHLNEPYDKHYRKLIGSAELLIYDGNWTTTVKVSNKYKDSYLEKAIIRIDSKLSKSLNSSVEVGTIDLSEGFYKSRNLQYSEVIFENKGVYNYKFSNGIQNSYYGLRTGVNFFVGPNKVILYLGRGNLRNVDPILAEYAIFDHNSKLANIKLDKIFESGVDFYTSSISHFYFKFTNSTFYIEESDYSKGLSDLEKYKIIQKYGKHAATFIGDIGSPYYIKINRLGYVTHNLSYSFMVEGYYLELGNDKSYILKQKYNINLNDTASHGYMVSFKYYPKYNQTITWSFGQSKQTKTGSKVNTNIGLAYSIKFMNYGIIFDVNRFDAPSWADSNTISTVKYNKPYYAYGLGFYYKF